VVAGDPAAEAATSGPKTFGRVLRQQGAEVTIDLGAADGVNVGQQMLFLDPTRPVSTPGWYTVLAVGVVSAVKEHGASVRMGLDEVVPTGAFAQRTNLQPSAAVVAPPRPLGWAVRGALRPFVAVNGVGGGALAELALDLRLKAPFHFSVNISPMGFGAQKGHGVGSFTGYALVGYDTRYGELGLGIGAQTINYVTAQKPGTGTVFPLFARIGAVDGLHLSARADLTLIYREYVLGSLRLDARAPVAQGMWLDASVGFGKAGYTLAELSLRRLLHGNGHAGSTFLNLGAGMSGLTRERCHDPPPELGIFDPSPVCQGKVQPLGIHLAAGLERRF
jgi:hypothetical protein